MRVYSLPDGTFAQSLDAASFDDPAPDPITLSIARDRVALTDPAVAVTLEYPFLDGVNALALSDDGGSLILAGGAPIGLYYQLDGGLVANFFMAESPVTVLAASPDGARVVAATGIAGLSELSVFDSAGNSTGVINGIPFEVTVAAFSSDGTRLLLALADGSVETYDAETLEFIGSVALHEGAVRALAISPDGRTIASGGDDTRALVWDAVSGEVVATLEGHSAPVLGVGFSPDGALLVTGGRDNAAYVWSVADGVQTAVLGEHYGAVTSVSVSPDGALILTTADDGAVRLYDALAGGDPLIAFYDHNAPVNAGAWLPDGLGFITGGADGLARRYEVVR
ncbi:MAG: WD40 repeat domain-containing protein [Anaerolineae bacterium]|nr:WD40 repeat domain-containing protein [Anaerolineae bacterium]